MRTAKPKIPSFAHYCLLINRQATNFSEKQLSELISKIRAKNDNYTLIDKDSVSVMLSRAESMCSGGSKVPDFIRRRGKVTALISCGGDGTLNLTSRVAMKHSLPVGIIPMGKENNIFRSLFSDMSSAGAISNIFQKKQTSINTGLIGNQIFLGSFGYGYTVELFKYFSERKLPRFKFGWSNALREIMRNVKSKKMTVKIDSFRFETDLRFLNINLQKYSAGLPFGNGSFESDKKLEVIFDFDASDKHFAEFSHKSNKGTYQYGSEIRMFHGEKITIQPLKNNVVYVDGELINIPSNIVEISMNEQQLKLLGASI